MAHRVSCCLDWPRERGRNNNDRIVKLSHFIVETVKTHRPGTVTVTGEDGPAIVAKNVMAGDVYFCSGQSNMVFPMKFAYNVGQVLVRSCLQHYCFFSKFRLRHRQSLILFFLFCIQPWCVCACFGFLFGMTKHSNCSKAQRDF